MKKSHLWVLAAFFAAGATSASAIVVPGGGPKRTDCLLELSTTTGQPFPAGRSALGATCADGDTCDPDAARNAVCRYSVSLCVNVTDPALPGCTARDLKSVKVKAAGPKGQRPDLSALEAAIAGLSLPSATPQCTAAVDLEVPVAGPNKKGEPQSGKVKLSARANRTKGQKHDVDDYELVCLPAAQVPPSPPPTLPPVSPETPDVGLKSAITAATVGADGAVQVTFTLTDDAGAPVTPVLSSTTDPDEARVRFTIARLDEVQETLEGLTRQFTRYRNYITSPQTSPITGQTSDLPTYDARGTIAAVDPVAGIWSYTFGKKLTEGFDGSHPHASPCGEVGGKGSDRQ